METWVQILRTHVVHTCDSRQVNEFLGLIGQPDPLSQEATHMVDLHITYVSTHIHEHDHTIKITQRLSSKMYFSNSSMLWMKVYHDLYINYFYLFIHIALYSRTACLIFSHIFMLICYSVQAFTTDFRVHWAQHPLRPEFAESTYFLYKVR